MLCTRILTMIYFKVHKKWKKTKKKRKKNKTVLLTRDKYVWRFVENQHTVLGSIEGKPSEGSSTLNLEFSSFQLGGFIFV